MAIALLQGCYYDVEEELYPESLTCDTTTITYSGSVYPILADNCLSCHSTAAVNGGVVLEGHSNAAIYANNGRLLGAITHASGFSPMPKNLPKLPDCDIATIRMWIEAGAPNN